MNKRVLLCLAHMSGNEQKYIQEAFEQNWVVPLGPNVNGFEDDLKRFLHLNQLLKRMQMRVILKVLKRIQLLRKDFGRSSLMNCKEKRL